jgi:hypothetical protein
MSKYNKAKNVFAATIHIFKITAVAQCTAWSSVISSDASSHNVRRVSEYDAHMQKAKHLLMVISDMEVQFCGNQYNM